MTVYRDVRYAIRTLIRSPGYTIAAVLTLTLGIGATTAVYSVVNSVLVQPLPYENGEDLVLLEQQAPGADIENVGFSVQELSDYRARNRTLDAMVEYHTLWFTLFDGGEPERVQSGVVSSNFFQVMGIQPVLGRAFLPSENSEGAKPVLILSHEYWQERFGGDPDVIGRTVEMNDQIHTIVGVLPDRLPEFPGNNDVWMPWYACPWRTGDMWQEMRHMRTLGVIARLEPGVTLAQGREDVARVAREMRAEFPAAYPDNAGYRVSLSPLSDELTNEARPVFLILLGMAGLVLLIACANVTNLTLARMAGREEEISIRASLGASRGRLIRQLVTENMVLSLVGGTAGLLLAISMADVLAAFAGRFTPRATEVQIDVWLLVVTFGVSILAGFAVGMISALLYGRNMAGSLRQGSGHSMGNAGRQRFRRVLVGSQVAVTFVLLIGAGLTMRSFVKLAQVDAGFNPENVMTMQIDLDWSAYADGADRRTFYRSLLDRVNAMPGVLSAGLAGTIPLGSGLPNFEFFIEGRAAPQSGAIPRTDGQIVSPGYFEALSIPLLRGRTFTLQDQRDSPPVVIINQSLARRYWGDANPIGARVSGDGEHWATVVGVVGNVKQEGLAGEFPNQLYSALYQGAPSGVNLLIRTRTNPLDMARQAIDAVHSIDPRQPVAFVQTMEAVRGEAIAPQRLTTLLIGLFAVLALAISVAGIAGLIAFTISQRVRELGIRIALGADRGTVLWMVLRQAATAIVIGLAVGLAGALALTGFIAGWLYDVPPTDPITFLFVSLILITAAGVAAYVPARRAVRVEPMKSLRSE